MFATDVFAADAWSGDHWWDGEAGVGPVRMILHFEVAGGVLMLG